MLIENLQIKNAFISYQNLSFDFSNDGFYLLVGKNGSGKTSIIESILFGKNTVSFDSDEEQRLYEKERYKLFAYVPQTIEESKLSVWNFLVRDNPSVNVEEISPLFSSFHLDPISFHEQYSRLSGGEKVKIAIISAILKRTRYFFLDEPTNYLDDQSVDELKSLLENLSKDHVVVVASHDTRLFGLESTRISLSGDSVEVSSIPALGKNKETAESQVCTRKANFSEISFLRINQPINYLFFALLIVFAINISLFVQNQYSQNFAFGELPEGGRMLIYCADYVYGEFNQRYCEKKGIQIDEQKVFDMIYLNDVPHLFEMPGVNRIYIKDLQKYDEYSLFQEHLVEAPETERIPVEYVALPSSLQRDSMYSGYLAQYNLLFLSSGRLPDDNASEVALSRKILEKCFGIEFEDDKEVIGTYVLIGEHSYKIVGVMSSDYCVLSYSDDLPECGVYLYSQDTFEAFKLRYQNFVEEHDYAYTNVDALACEVDVLKEEAFLNAVIQQFPANNYYSRTWEITTQSAVNEALVAKMLWLVMPVSSLFGVVFLLLQANQISQNIEKLRSYMRYYFSKAVLSHYILQMICGVFLTLVAVVLFNLWYNSYTEVWSYMSWLVYASWLLLVLPSCVYFVLKLIKVEFSNYRLLK